jgi:hypothetical protein
MSESNLYDGFILPGSITIQDLCNYTNNNIQLKKFFPNLYHIEGNAIVKSFTAGALTQIEKRILSPEGLILEMSQEVRIGDYQYSYEISIIERGTNLLSNEKNIFEDIGKYLLPSFGIFFGIIAFVGAIKYIQKSQLNKNKYNAFDSNSNTVFTNIK